MADQDQVTVYRGTESKVITPSLWSVAKEKGWTLRSPQADEQDKSAKTPFAKPGFGAGFNAGVNPMHSTPQLPNPGTGGKGMNMAADAFNIRETVNRAQQGDMKGAVGEGLGTLTQAGASAGLSIAGKGMKAAGLGERATREIPLLADAAESATKLAKSLKVTPDIARFATRYTEPFFKAVDSKFDVVHQVLDKEVIPMPSNAIRLVKRMATKAEIPGVQKIAQELEGRTALGYKEAEAIRRNLMQMAQGEAEHWRPQVEALAKALDGEIDTLAKSKGVGDIRKAQRAIYGEVMDLTKAVASTAKSKGSKMGMTADAGAGIVGDTTGVLGKVGTMLKSETSLRIAPVIEARAKQLAKKLGVSMSELVSEPGKLEKAGTAAKVAGKVGEVAGPAKRAGESFLSPQEQDASQAK